MHLRSILGGRTLALGAPGSMIAWPAGRFVALVPAYSADERMQLHALLGELIERGCIELCCVGPEAERLHDDLDALLEEREAFDVVTTADLDPREACDYFLFTADAGASDLVALVGRHPELVELLDLLVADA